jgi:hypothetical protein
VAINGVKLNKSDAALPELNTMLRIQPTNDSIIYLTPCSFSSELRPGGFVVVVVVLVDGDTIQWPKKKQYRRERKRKKAIINSLFCCMYSRFCLPGCGQEGCYTKRH